MLRVVRTLRLQSRSTFLRHLCTATAGSDGSTTLWHNPSCSKSCAALALLTEQEVEFTVREYLEHPPSFSELQGLKQQLGLPPIEWVRVNDAAWAEHFPGVTIYDDLLPDDDDILRGIAKNPIMIERPILVHGKRAVVGRPPELVLRLLDGTLPAPLTAAGFMQAPQPSAPTASEDPIRAIARLKDLLDNGALTQAEFEAKKAELLRKI